MHPEIHKLGQTFTRFIEARIAGQWQALRDEWEPKLVDCLAGLAELKAGLAAGEAPPAWLAGGKALEESVRKGLAEFRRRVAQSLSRSQAEALAGLEADANWWRGRLKAVAVTVLHGVFNRTQRAVLEA